MTSPRIVFLAWAAGVIVAAIILATQVSVVTGLGDFLGGGETYSLSNRLMISQLKEGPATGTVIVILKGASPENLVKASDAAVSALESSSLFDTVTNGRAGGAESFEAGPWFTYRYLLAPPSPDQFTSAGLAASLENRLAELASPASAFMRDTIKRDPTAAYWSYIERISSGARQNLSAGVWMSKNKTEAYLVAAGGSFKLDDDGLRQIRNRVTTATVLAVGDKVEVSLTGPAVFASISREIIKRETEWMSVVATIAVGLFLVLLLRVKSSMLSIMLPLLTGAVAGCGAVAIAFGNIHGIALAFGITIIGVAVDYPLHAIIHARSGGSGRDTVMRIWPTLRLSALTTSTGYAAMLFSDLDGLAQIGLFSITGVITAALCVRYLLPQLLTEESLLKAGGAATFFTKLAGAKPLRLIILIVLVADIAFIAFGPVWDDDVGKLNPVPQADRAVFEKACKVLGGNDVGKIIAVTGRDSETALINTEAFTKLLDTLVEQGAIADFESAVKYLPSKTAQIKAQKSLPTAIALRRALDSAVAKTPFGKNVFDPFLADVGKSRNLKPLTLNDIRNTAIGLKVESMLKPIGPEWVSMISLAGVTDEGALKTVVENSPNAIYLNLRDEATHLLASHRTRAINLAGVGGLIILLLLGVALKSKVAMAKAVFTIVAPVLATAGIMSYLGGLSIFHLVSLLLVAGLGVDYALFLNRGEQENDPVSIFAVGACALSTAIVFTTLAFSDLYPLHAIGLTTVTGVTLTFLTGLALYSPANPDNHKELTYEADSHYHASRLRRRFRTGRAS